MNTAILQLRHYFVSELNVVANRTHESTKPVNLTTDNLVVNSNFLQDKKDAREWQVTLRLQQSAGADTNSPYSFAIELVGFFGVAPTYAVEKAEWMVRTNATAVLYSTAREVLRAAMAQGPFCPLLLPTVSFYTPETKKMLDAAKNAGKNQALPPAETPRLPKRKSAALRARNS